MRLEIVTMSTPASVNWLACVCGTANKTLRLAFQCAQPKSLQAALYALGEGGFPSISPNNTSSLPHRPRRVGAAGVEEEAEWEGKLAASRRVRPIHRDHSAEAKHHSYFWFNVWQKFRDPWRSVSLPIDQRSMTRREISENPKSCTDQGNNLAD